jgi:hypothetical protein
MENINKPVITLTAPDRLERRMRHSWEAGQSVGTFTTLEDLLVVRLVPPQVVAEFVIGDEYTDRIAAIIGTRWATNLGLAEAKRLLESLEANCKGMILRVVVH